MTRTTITQKLTAAAIFFTALTAANANDSDTFLAAARSGDVAQVERLLAGGSHANARDNSGNTALHYAAAFGYAEMAQILVDAGADVDAPGRIGNTPLHLASQEGHSNIAAILIDHGGPQCRERIRRHFTRLCLRLGPP